MKLEVCFENLGKNWVNYFSKTVNYKFVQIVKNMCMFDIHLGKKSLLTIFLKLLNINLIK